ncbi:MAG: hypothetical protein KFH98_14280 [Gemmatimonadetes bacterium]|nr:hypothetical protein [Gemmatimonadota bacterium]
MAPGLKWAATVITGCALVTAWALTISNPVDAVTPAGDETRRAMEANARALHAAESAYREYALADSLLPLLPTVPGMTVSLSPALHADARDTIAAVAAREMAHVTAPQARIGIFLADNAYGRRPGVPLYGVHEERKLFAGEDSAGAYCAIVATGTRTDNAMLADGFRAEFNLRQGRNSGPVVGPCAVMARYGAPGPRIAEWLRSGAYHFAAARGTTEPIQARDRARMELSLWTRDDIRMRGCIGGRERHCTDMVLNPAPGRLPPTLVATFNLGSSVRMGPWPMLLSDLEATFGTQRFEQFWTSGHDVPTAFAAAFGVGVGEWVRQWGQSYYLEPDIGPAVNLLNVMLTFGTLLLLAGLACAVAMRRGI